MVVFTGMSWFLLTGLIQFAFSPIAGNILGITLMIIFTAVPTVNHVGMFLAIRRHNTFAAGASVPQQV